MTSFLADGSMLGIQLSRNLSRDRRVVFYPEKVKKNDKIVVLYDLLFIIATWSDNCPMKGREGGYWSMAKIIGMIKSAEMELNQNMYFFVKNLGQSFSI